MYPRPFHYHRAGSLSEAASILSDLGEDAKLLAGGQSLIPLMKLRMSSPQHLVDLNFVPDTAYIRANGALRVGAMTRHADIAASAEASRIAILHDCAAGIADPQVRNMGTIGGSVAEADPTADWAPVLSVTGATVHTLNKSGQRTIEIGDFIQDAYVTVLQPGEIIREIAIPPQPPRTGGAYLALKRCAPVYATATCAVQLTMEDDGRTCKKMRLCLGVLGLTPTRVRAAEEVLIAQEVTEDTLEKVRQAVMDIAEPNSDMRGSAEYKRHAAGVLAKLAVEAAIKRACGHPVEVSHLYA
jgi:carbon-monoxide dehydrogenase medium subunit